jgi:hypothetical protein
MKTVRPDAFNFTFLDFLSLHSAGLLVAVLLAVAFSWAVANRGGL